MKKDRFVTIIKSSNDSENMGDDIIFELSKEYLFQKFKSDFLFYTSQKMPSDLTSLKHQKQSDIQLLLGTKAVMTRYKPDFLRKTGIRIGFIKSRKIKGKVVLMGVGSDGGGKFSFLQKRLYKKLLSKTEYHSVRDEHTKELLENIGFKNVLNTSCPTTWNLKSFVAGIPNSDSNLILSFSLSNDDLNFVQKIINQASEKYKNVYIWIQTRAEKAIFINKVVFKKNVSIINQNLHSFFEVASKENTFYIGSRLHASIFNLYNNNPSVTIKIDQRADGINKAVNIPIIDYSLNLDLSSIEEKFKDTINISDNKIKESKEIFLNN